MPYLVRENLFIGGIGDAADVLEQGSTEITHILSLLSAPSISFFTEWRSTTSIPVKETRKVYFEESKEDCLEEDSAASSSGKLLYSLEYAGKELKVTRMAVPLMDMENQNLLDYLDVCLDFIEKSRKQGSVLVHGFAAVSRSAAVTTAYLMRSEHLSCEDALESLRNSCEFVCPNDGFLNQLKMFEEMGFKVDHASAIYKLYHMKKLGEAYERGEMIDRSKFGADPALPKQVVEASSSSTYRCKKCRRLVASQANVIEHTPGGGETSFGWHKRKNGKSSNKPHAVECSSIFIEPLRWMKTVEEGLMESKLSCVHCDARLGHFNWYGIQCSCGSWITPAFQLHKSRVDISTL